MQTVATPAVNAAAPKASAAQRTPAAQAAAARNATDDEILGLIAEAALDGAGAAERDARAERQYESGERGGEGSDKKRARRVCDAARPGEDGDPERLRAAFEANPELRQAWDDAKAYREAFATPERRATRRRCWPI